MNAARRSIIGFYSVPKYIDAFIQKAHMFYAISVYAARHGYIVAREI